MRQSLARLFHTLTKGHNAAGEDDFLSGCEEEVTTWNDYRKISKSYGDRAPENVTDREIDDGNEEQQVCRLTLHRRYHS